MEHPRMKARRGKVAVERVGLASVAAGDTEEETSAKLVELGRRDEAAADHLLMRGVEALLQKAWDAGCRTNEATIAFVVEDARARFGDEKADELGRNLRARCG